MRPHCIDFGVFRQKRLGNAEHGWFDPEAIGLTFQPARNRLGSHSGSMCDSAYGAVVPLKQIAKFRAIHIGGASLFLFEFD
jgi:hypothetical protein